MINVDTLIVEHRFSVKRNVFIHHAGKESPVSALLLQDRTSSRFVNRQFIAAITYS